MIMTHLSLHVQPLVQFRCDLLHLQRKVLHPLLQLHVIISQQDLATGDKDINSGFTFVSSTFQPMAFVFGVSG